MIRRLATLFIGIALSLGTTSADSLLNQNKSNPAGPYTMEKRPKMPYPYKVHDTIFIDISIQDTLEFTKKLETDKEVTLGAKIKNFITNFKTVPTRNPNIEVEQTKELKTEGKKRDTSKVRIQIPAEVVEKLPNGDLVLDASRTVTNGEDTAKVRVGGRVNPKYIMDDMVASDKILQLSVKTDAKGPLSRNQKRGLITRFFEIFNPL